MPTPLIPFAPIREIPLTRDTDLVVNFRRRDPADPNVYIDYPAGVLGRLKIYASLKDAALTDITTIQAPNGSDLFIKVSWALLADVQDGTEWVFAFRHPDGDFEDDYYDAPVLVGTIVLHNGREPE